MATPGVMLKEVLLNTSFTFIEDISISGVGGFGISVGFSGDFEVYGDISNAAKPLSVTDVADTADVPSYETTRFASMAGILADHPLRDDWLKNMGLSPDIDLDVL